MDHEPRLQTTSEPPAERQRGGLVVKMLAMSDERVPVGGHGVLEIDAARLAADIKAWARELGFQAAGIADVDLSAAEAGLSAWLAAGFHGAMAYMERHGLRRARPAALVPGTVRVISVRMDYWPEAAPAHEALADRARGYVSRYALGRDYHKVLRNRLQRLADRIADAIGPFGHRVFTDSAPVLEVELAVRGGLGWRGKHTLALARDAGSYFFLAELFVDLPLPADAPTTDHCGTCTRCIDACPTGALDEPWTLDATRCLSYWTQSRQRAPADVEDALEDRVYGCDICQDVCPWNAGPAARAAGIAPEGEAFVSLVDWLERPGAELLAEHARLYVPDRDVRYLRRNALVALGNGPEEHRHHARPFADADDPLLRAVARRALGQ